MQISAILDDIDEGRMALPEFQRGYVWGGDQVRSLFNSLYRRHPVGGLLVWATKSDGAAHRGDQALPLGQVNLLLDGQQRITSLYGVIRGKPPKFFDGNEKAFTNLHFNLGSQEFQFYQPILMKDDPLWINVTALFKGGNHGVGSLIGMLASNTQYADQFPNYFGRLNDLLGIRDLSLHVETISGPDKDLDVVVDIFNKVNSGGTKLSKGDLALAKICADWPEARAEMKKRLSGWKNAGYDFSLDWLLRSVNTVLTGEAKFLYLHDRSPEEVKGALTRAGKHIENALNLIAGRLGLDHDRVLFGRGAISVMARYLDQLKAPMGAAEQDKLLFWYAQAGMWGRFSGSTESYIDVDLKALEDGGLEQMLEMMRLQHGLRVEPGHFGGWNMGARFYPVLYMLTRMAAARDWGTGLPLKANLLGKHSRLEVHHIFPKALLSKANYGRADVNAIANFCFLTKITNLNISDERPEVYFEEIEKLHPGALASQWIPMDRALWKIENYPKFLAARRELLATEANTQLASLLHGDDHWLATTAPVSVALASSGGLTSEADEAALEELRDWAVNRGLAEGVLAYELVDPTTGEQRAILDLAWPNGVRSELTEPVAVLIDEGGELVALASSAGFRCFASAKAFRAYVAKEIESEPVA